MNRNVKTKTHGREALHDGRDSLLLLLTKIYGANIDTSNCKEAPLIINFFVKPFSMHETTVLFKIR